MKISKTHQKFSYLLEEPKALTNPEDYLGPNWKEILNFWLYADGLSEEERVKIGERYWDLDEDVRNSSVNSAINATSEVVLLSVRSAAWNATLVVTYAYIFSFATDELIAQHKLLEQEKSLVFLPICSSTISSTDH
jgi:hypothetical protein